MFRPRIIPVLLLKGVGLVKSVQFKNHRYIGDPINAVKIFNDLRADELCFFDISATKEKRLISLQLIQQIGDEANMPFAVGGGIRSLYDIQQILQNGAEKVILNTAIFNDSSFVRNASNEFGSSTIAVSLDIKRNIFGKKQLVYYSASKISHTPPVEFAQKLEHDGVGEIIVQSVDRDGTYCGYDLDLINCISQAVTIPVVALGGAKDYADFSLAVNKGHASAVAAGSLFVFHGPRKAVLISFPSQQEITRIFN